MKLVHYNDGKGKHQSHEVYLKDDPDFSKWKDGEFFFNRHDLSDIVGYGETKEEAISNFMKKFQEMMNEYRAIESLLIQGAYQENMEEVNYSGKPVK